MSMKRLYISGLFLFYVFLTVCVFAESPYVLETGPEKGAGLPFLSNDLSLFFTGTYLRRDTGFRVRVFYTADRPDLSSRETAGALPCLPGRGYSTFHADADPAFSEKLLVYSKFESKGWDPYFSPEEDPSPQEPKQGLLFFAVSGGDENELCTFIPLFEERLRYYMNARKREFLLPLPAVIVIE